MLTYAVARPLSGWIVRRVTPQGVVHTINEGCSLELARLMLLQWSKSPQCIACCIDNRDGIHCDGTAGDIDVLRWAWLR